MMIRSRSLLLWVCVCVILNTAKGFSLFERDRCPKKLSIGDKWYDGCKWCICTDFGPSCTSEICLPFAVKPEVCRNVGERWLDGCYRCRCRPGEIICHADQRCVVGLKDLPVDCGLHSGCICGLDGVPSCIKDVLKKQKQLNQRWITVLSRNANGKKNSTDDCKIGRRWYDGPNRCVCQRDKAKCGNPRRIAQRVDGFRLKAILCPSRLTWEHNCKKCTCHVSGVAFCVRTYPCKRQKVSVETGLRKADCTPDSKGTGECQESLDKTKASVCDNKSCLKADSNSEKGKPEDKVSGISPNYSREFHFRRHVQVPPAPPALPRRTEGPRMCGKYKPGQVFWKDCNLCKCTPFGDTACTAMMCR